jgi:exosortase/archaeosortase family protein
LKRFWTKVLLLSFVVPVAVFKNAVRIVTLTLLSGFIDMKIIRGGFLHKSGGFVFFGLGLFVMGIFLFIFKEMESRH